MFPQTYLCHPPLSRFPHCHDSSCIRRRMSAAPTNEPIPGASKARSSCRSAENERFVGDIQRSYV